MTVSVGVIGVGVMGAEHARLLSDEVSGARVEALFDVDATRAGQVAAAAGSARVLSDPLELIADESVEAVLIASSDATHEQFVLACLAAEKPVLCEKPLAPDVDGCARVLAAEVDLGRRLVSVGFMRRYDPGYHEMREALRGGDLGTPLMLHCIHRNPSSPTSTSAALIAGSAVHEIDIARWLLDEEFATVTVHSPRRAASGDLQDPMFLVFESESGVLVDVDVFINAQYGYDVRAELVTQLGTVVLDTPRATVTRYNGAVARTLPPDWRPRFAEAYRRELQDWVDGVVEGDPARAASAWDGYVATVVAQAGIRALDSGQREVISLDDKPALYK